VKICVLRLVLQLVNVQASVAVGVEFRVRRLSGRFRFVVAVPFLPAFR
jgi:hypothetical protein